MDTNFASNDFWMIITSEVNKKIEELKIIDMPCKHVLSLDSTKAKSLLEASHKIGYDQVMWGYGSGIYQNSEENRIIQINTIRRMIYKGFTRGFRIVVDSSGYVWVDNLHSAIRDIIVWGHDVRIGDVPHYVVDLSSEIVKVMGDRNYISDSLQDIYGAISVSYKRDRRTSDEVRQVGYTIGEFMNENAISRESINLSETIYAQYMALDR